MKKYLLLFVMAILPAMMSAQVFYNGQKLGTSRITGSKVGNVVGAYFTVGLSPANSSKIIEGASAETIIKESKPTFVIKFDENSKDSVFQNRNKIAGIVLLKLHPKGKIRKLFTGKYGLVAGVQTKVAEKDVVPISVDDSADDIIIKPKVSLEKGEYAFYSIDTVQTKIYDFSVE